MQILIVVFFIASGTQVLYLIAFLTALLRQRAEHKSIAAPVSVLVCAHDEEHHLKELVPVLLSQDHPEFEVLIVNDRSNDGTYDFLLEETKKDPRLRMVHVDQVPDHINGKKFGITLGIKAASYEWILFTDADCRPATNRWLTEMSSAFDSQAQFVLGFSPYFKSKGLLNLFIRFETFLTAIQYLTLAMLNSPYMGVGRNLAYRKSLFLEKKGFNHILGVTGGDDDLFVNQHAHNGNTRVQFTPGSHTFSFPEKTWKSFFFQKVRHLSVGKRYRLKHRLLLGAFVLSWIITWFAGVSLLIIDPYFIWVPAFLVTRLFVLLVLIGMMARQTAVAFELWAVPFLDFIYSIYYISTGLAALVTKKIRWRN